MDSRWEQGSPHRGCCVRTLQSRIHKSTDASSLDRVMSFTENELSNRNHRLRRSFEPLWWEYVHYGHDSGRRRICCPTGRASIPVVRPDFHPYEELPQTLLERTEWEDPLDRQGPMNRKLITNLETGSVNRDISEICQSRSCATNCPTSRTCSLRSRPSSSAR